MEGGAVAVNEAVVAKNPSAGWGTLFNPEDPVTASAWLVFLLFVAHLPIGVVPHIGNKFMALKNARQMRTFLMLVMVAGGILPMMSLAGILGAAVLGQNVAPDAVVPTLFAELFPQS